MRDCKNCPYNNSAEWNEKNCPYLAVNNCADDDFDTWLENHPDAVIQGHSFD